MAKILLSIMVERRVRERLERIAAKEDRSLSGLVRRIIFEWLARRK